MRHHRKLTDDERRQIVEARAGGVPAAALACSFGVSPRTIYNTLNRARAPGPTAIRTRSVTTRVSDRDLTGFMAALAKRGITDRPAAVRRLMGAADKILMAPDPVTAAMLKGWTAEIQSHGTAINQIARKLNEARLIGRSPSYSADDEAAICALMAFTFTLIADFQDLWGARREAISREVDEALSGLKAGGCYS
ncbi:helix-turn-helix domain-containing protein [Albidovulum sediminis]|uniref:Helix-turn-helix domain-containing protein n=1 Tax=Albidovulum sediminis TaxID=3066345 RepID=A0ABT2NGL8_9RHOB|nr:helix-turn-helix domain-containing protein [Defluviimonas sediminis]MCT8327916.1 helix-turn-helix domain-containing protein [Defluviimonas sediminis]